ncbi:DNA polymerase subunit beta [filamentous cyanobacterium CCP2]|nr:DNA polymerase subunit beta [filamentous cyanobacterium CCP2]
MEVEDKYLKYWRDRRQRQQEMNQRFALQARQEAQQMADVLVQQFGATQVILFGSLAKGRFTAESDIDLAVEGIEPAQFFAALASANRLTNRWVDLKPMEALEPYFYQRVMETGEVLYARDVSD